MPNQFDDALGSVLEAVAAWEHDMPHDYIDALPPGVSLDDAEADPGWWSSCAAGEFKRAIEIPMIRLEAAARSSGRAPLFNKARRYLDELLELIRQLDLDANKYVFRENGHGKSLEEITASYAQQWAMSLELADEPRPLDKLRAMLPPADPSPQNAPRVVEPPAANAPDLTDTQVLILNALGELGADSEATRQKKPNVAQSMGFEADSLNQPMAAMVKAGILGSKAGANGGYWKLN